MGGMLGSLAFLNPWVLAGLVFLPLLWFLLRVTPPAPRLIVFPAAHFLAGLVPEQQTTSRTPWWILLLRLLILALIITALARPVLNPGAALPGAGPVRLVIDNGWAAAQSWTDQTRHAADLAARAGREGREIHIMTTAPEPGQDTVFYAGPLSQGQAESILRGLAPQPWPAAYERAAHKVSERSARGSNFYNVILSHGLADGNAQPLLRALQDNGNTMLVRPAPSQYPLLLRPPRGSTSGLNVLVDAPRQIAEGVPVSVQALGRDGRVIDVQQVSLNKADLPMEVALQLPEMLRGQVTQLRLGGRQGAGAVIILDDQFKRRNVGIVAPTGEAETAPLIEASYYLKRALEPYAVVTTGTIDELLGHEPPPAMLILPDIGAMPPEALNTLERWTEEGGLLLRFAGPNMTQAGDQFLTPVPLRRGGRALDGALTWDKPVQLAPFPETSSFFGMATSDDVTVRRQILAEPVPGLDEKSWALLEDGTPLITADGRGAGLLVMVHTTATAAWSDLALSGLYVQILRRLVNMAGSSGAQAAPESGMLQPIAMLNGFGATEAPQAHVRPISSADFEAVIPGSSHPPGLYGRAGYQAALNLGDRIAMPQAFPAALPAGVSSSLYSGAAEKDLMPWLLAAALALFFIDWIIMIAMQLSMRGLQAARGALKMPRFARMVLLGALLLGGLSQPAAAQGRNDAAYAGDIYMAYISSGEAAIDNTARSGLEVLGEILALRTSVEPAGVVAVDPEHDELSFFPFIYWPVAPDQATPTEAALRKLQHYLDHGGTILFDTRDQISAPRGTSGAGGGRNAATLRRMIGTLNIPPLKAMPDDHVLTKAFYLLRSYPGRYDNGTIWVEEQSVNGRDGVSSVIIGGHDWATAWAAGSTGVRLDGGSRQQELALRFGVNVMMYALTGNYKSDQVHVPHILERLGQ